MKTQFILEEEDATESVVMKEYDFLMFFSVGDYFVINNTAYKIESIQIHADEDMVKYFF